MKKVLNSQLKIIILITCIIIVLFGIFLLYNPFLTLKLMGNSTISLEVMTNYDEEGYEAKFLNNDLTKDVKIIPNIDVNKVGEYTITYTIKALLTTKSIERKIKIVDETKPEIILNGEKNIKLCPNHEYNEEGYNAVDNYDGDITDKVQKKIENNVIQYTVLDSSNNENKQERIITYIDDEKPNIILKSDSKIYVLKNKKYTDLGYSAIDNCDGEITDKVTVLGNVDTSKYGEYKLTYNVEDTFGNANNTTRLISVVDYIYDSSTTYQPGNGYGGVIFGPTYIRGILIINKKYTLPSTYNPGLNNEAVSNLNNLKNAALNAGHNIPTVSGYRSYSSQKTIYNRNINNRGYAKTDFVSARPGHSEHQSGLAFDVGALDNNYGETAAGKWLQNNCYKYGFIIRYPKGKTNITGYNYEPWHIRYVGVDAATYIMTNNLTLEEYLKIA